MGCRVHTLICLQMEHGALHQKCTSYYANCVDRLPDCGRNSKSIANNKGGAQGILATNSRSSCAESPPKSPSLRKPSLLMLYSRNAQSVAQSAERKQMPTQTKKCTATGNLQHTFGSSRLQHSPPVLRGAILREQQYPVHIATRSPVPQNT